MKLVGTLFNLDTVTAEASYGANNQTAQDLIYRPDRGTLLAKMQYTNDFNWLKLATINPFSKTLISKTASRSFPIGDIIGYDYDQNKVLFSFGDSASIFIQEQIGDTENAVTIFSYTVPGYYPRAVIRTGGYYYVLTTNGFVNVRRASDNFAMPNIPGPYGANTCDVCCAGVDSLIFATSDPGSNGIMLCNMQNGGILSSRNLSWDTSDMPSPTNAGFKTLITCNLRGRVWMGMFDGSDYKIYEFDITSIPSALMVEVYPLTLPGDGESEGLLVGRAIDSDGYPVPNVTVKAEPSGSFLSGSYLVNSEDVSDALGLVSFTYHAPVVTGTQSFIMKAYR